MLFPSCFVSIEIHLCVSIHPYALQRSLAAHPARSRAELRAANKTTRAKILSPFCAQGLPQEREREPGLGRGMGPGLQGLQQLCHL